MKKLIVVLMAVAVAAPTMAAVTLTCTQLGVGQGKVSYSWDGNGQRPRAFALNVEVSAGTITGCTPSKTGESTSGSKGFGIFPGTIDLTDPCNPVWNTPIEPNGLPGASGSGLGTNKIVVVLGSLYRARDANVAPNATGDLFTVGVSSCCTVTITPETTYRRGVMGEDGNTIPVAPAICSLFLPPEPLTGVLATNGTQAGQITITWTPPAEPVDSYQVYYNIKNDTSTSVLLNSNATSPYNFVTQHGETIWFWVKATNACGQSGFSNGDSGYITECFPSAHPKYSTWVTYGRPDCWCCARQCHGDADCLPEGKTPNGPYWVGGGDLTILKSAWSKLDSQLSGNNICADFDWLPSGKPPMGPYRVSGGDLTILKSSWQRPDPNPPPDCVPNPKAYVRPTGLIP
jgi:hypothetical protein